MLCTASVKNEYSSNQLTVTKDIIEEGKKMTSKEEIEKMISVDKSGEYMMEGASIQLPIAEDKMSPNEPQLVSEALHGIMDEELRFKFDKYRQMFSVYRPSGEKVKSFTIPQIVDMMVSRRLETRPNSDTMTQYLITHLVGGIDPRTVYGFLLKNQNESPFMSDVESVIRLNNALYHFEIKELSSFLDKYESDDREKVERVVKHFVYSMLHHTLKILNLVSEQIKNDPTQKELKSNVLNYTIGIVYRISRFVYDEISYIGSQLKRVNDNYRLVVKSREELGIKIDKLIDTFNKPQPIPSLEGGDNKEPRQTSDGAKICDESCYFEELIMSSEGNYDIEDIDDFQE